MKRISIFYIITITLVTLAILAVLRQGGSLPHPASPSSPEQIARAAVKVAPVDTVVGAPASAWDSMLTGLQQNLNHPLGHLFIQIIAIIFAARVAGHIFTRIGQPSVVGEMAAGILLGPSLLGWMMPETFAFIFPESSLGSLKLLSQVGVCFFMFSVGMELDMGHVRKKAHTAVVVSHASIVFPYLLGVVLAYFLYTDLAASGASFTAFALFMGISMSITAFPVLARILQERGLTKTFLGSTAITCAAVDDVTAWSLLAFVVAIAQATSVVGSALNLLLVLVYLAIMLWIVRPGLVRWIGKKELAAEDPSPGTLAVVVCVVIASALCTEVIGIHAFFGAFLAGVIMPDTHGFRHRINVRVQTFSSVLLLPLFFAYTGLRTQIGLLNDIGGWLLCLLIIAVATLGKLGGSAFAARFSGMSWRESLQLGSLMNTRGLMELIALNIGYDLGILSPRIFAMLVIMALVTTMMTGPLLTWFGGRKQPAPGALPSPGV